MQTKVTAPQVGTNLAAVANPTSETRPGYDDVTGVGSPNIDGLLGGSAGGNPSAPNGPAGPVHGQPMR